MIFFFSPGHPLCANLRDGDWLAKYIVARLERRESTAKLAKWLEVAFGKLYQLPRYLIPRYFDAILCPLYTIILDRVWVHSSEFVRHGDDFTKRLALGGVALIGSQPTSSLPQLVAKTIPAAFKHLDAKYLPTMSAGLPFFASGYMRCWGRDTFIALKGLTLLTGRFDEAKLLILGFGGALRHGLVPNLLDGGHNARFNCRDAVWWWLQAIKDYIHTAPDGHKILNEEVHRLYPTDDLDSKTSVASNQPLSQTIQEALERHFGGIDFIERNAGPKIDEHMKLEGFNVKVWVDRETGFVCGGNEWNCGTWMDKMGSAEKAGNKGHPATPRDGAAVEIVGLCKSVVTMLAELNEKKLYPYDGVAKYDNGKLVDSWTWTQWAQKIEEFFEKRFFVDEDCQDKLVNRRNIYKDTVGATKPWMDFQLRPNFVVAMCVAPELFDRKHAMSALDIADKALLAPLGMKTLDPR